MKGGFDIGVVETEYSGQEDRRWLGTRMGWDQCRSITLDVSLFVAAHVTDKGALPGGTLLGEVTSSGLYGPYDADASNGLETCAGFLFTTTKIGDGTGTDLATAANVGTALYWGPGIIKESYLPSFTGTTDGEIDAAARTDLGGFIRFES